MDHQPDDAASPEMVDAGERILIERAGTVPPETIAYGKFGELVADEVDDCPPFEFPQDTDRMAALLRRVSRRHWKQPSDPLLCAIVVRADSGAPDRGFYRLASEDFELPVGRTSFERLQFWMAQAKQVFDTDFQVRPGAD